MSGRREAFSDGVAALLLFVSSALVILGLAIVVAAVLPSRPSEQPTPIVHRVETPERVCYVVTYADTLHPLGCDARGDTDD